MAKLISAGDASTVQAMAPGPRRAFMADFKSWWLQGRQLADALFVASSAVGRTTTAQDDTDTKAALTAWFASQPDTASYT